MKKKLLFFVVIIFVGMAVSKSGAYAASSLAEPKQTALEEVSGEKSITENIELAGAAKQDVPFQPSQTSKKKGGITIWGVIIVIVTGAIVFLVGRKVIKFIYSKIVDEIDRRDGMEMIERIIDEADNPIKKMILQNYLSCDDLISRQYNIEEIIDTLKKKIRKKDNPKLREQLEKSKAELLKITAELSDIQLDVDKDVSDIEKRQYETLCESFAKVRLSEKIWIVTSPFRDTELKPEATIERVELSWFKKGINHLKSSFDIPVLSCNVIDLAPYDIIRRDIHVYPRYIIDAETFNSLYFEVSSIQEIHFKYSKQRFIGNDDCPVKCIVDYTYQYANVDGGPDRRFLHNPSFPVVEYGKIEIEELGLTYLISDCAAAEEFVNAYKRWQDKSFIHEIP